MIFYSQKKYGRSEKYQSVKKSRVTNGQTLKNQEYLEKQKEADERVQKRQIWDIENSIYKDIDFFKRWWS